MAFKLNKAEILKIAEQKAQQHMLERAQIVAKGTLCPEHGQTPTVRSEGSRLAVGGCCENVQQKVISEMKAPQL